MSFSVHQQYQTPTAKGLWCLCRWGDGFGFPGFPQWHDPASFLGAHLWDTHNPGVVAQPHGGCRWNGLDVSRYIQIYARICISHNTHHVYIYIYIHIYIYIIYIYIYIHIYIYIYIYVYIYIYYVCICIYLIKLYIYIHTYVLYITIHTHIYIYNLIIYIYD